MGMWMEMEMVGSTLWQTWSELRDHICDGHEEHMVLPQEPSQESSNMNISHEETKHIPSTRYMSKGFLGIPEELQTADLYRSDGGGDGDRDGDGDGDGGGDGDGDGGGDGDGLQPHTFTERIFSGYLAANATATVEPRE